MRRILLTFVSILIALSTSLYSEVPTQENVTKLYVATFNRAPDAAGLYYWVNDSGLQLEGIAQSFFDQPETKEKYPPGSTNIEFVEAVYANLFNREPDQAGLDYWVGELDSGSVGKSVFILAVINGAQNTVEFGNDATILTNKEIVGLAFADAGLDDVTFAKEIMNDITDDTNTVIFALQSLSPDIPCSMTSDYFQPEPIFYPASASSTTTVIALHGKNGSPLAFHMDTLASDLNQKGYDVILPYMPWSRFTWDRTYCDGMSHLNDLIAEEQNKGKDVILLGHSIGGPIVLAYAVRKDVIKPKAVVAVAPGHFIHQSSLLASYHAESIELAHSMVDADQSTEYATFETWNSEIMEIFTTPEVYLSFHDTALFPDIISSISLTTGNTLWLAGIDDSLTSIAKNVGIYSAIQSNSNYTYKEIPGDHISLVNNVADELHNWFSGL